MMNQTANIALLVTALLDMIVLLGGDITAHRDNGHNNSRYYAWLNKSGEFLSPKRLLLLAVFIATFTTMALESWIVVMLLAALLLVQAIVLLSSRQWKLMASDKRMGRMLAVAMILSLIVIGIVDHLGSKVSALFASRVTSMVAVMLLPITPLLTMLVAWMIGAGHDVNGPEPPDQQD